MRIRDSDSSSSSSAGRRARHRNNRRHGGGGGGGRAAAAAADCIIFSPGSFWNDDRALFASDAAMHEIGRQSTVAHTATLFDLMGGLGDESDHAAGAEPSRANQDDPPSASNAAPPPLPPSSSSSSSSAPPGAHPLPRSVLLPGLSGIRGLMMETYHAPKAAVLIALKPPGTLADLSAEQAFFAALGEEIMRAYPGVVSVGDAVAVPESGAASNSSTALRPPASAPASSPLLPHTPLAPVPMPVYVRFLELGQQISSHEQTYFLFVYLLVFCYIYLSVDTVKTSVKSKFGLGFTAGSLRSIVVGVVVQCAGALGVGCWVSGVGWCLALRSFLAVLSTNVTICYVLGTLHVASD